MTHELIGLHHVTAISGPPRPTLDFYQHVLGLRLVKLTINYDDPATYHLYFGDRSGRPGTLITFFPWLNAKAGRSGAGQVTATAYAVPRGSLRYWQSHLAGADIEPHVTSRFGHDLIRLRDPDGLPLELVEVDSPPDADPWLDGPVDASCAITALRAVTMEVADPSATAAFFEHTLGMHPADEDTPHARFHIGGASHAPWVEVRRSDGQSRRGIGPGTVHHVAFCVADENALRAWRDQLIADGTNVTDVRDRMYFKSIYFREPGGVIIELATLGPGASVDEAVDELGGSLRLPPWLEPQRDEIVRSLPPIDAVAT